MSHNNLTQCRLIIWFIVATYLDIFMLVYCAEWSGGQYEIFKYDYGKFGVWMGSPLLADLEISMWFCAKFAFAIIFYIIMKYHHFSLLVGWWWFYFSHMYLDFIFTWILFGGFLLREIYFCFGTQTTTLLASSSIYVMTFYTFIFSKIDIVLIYRTAKGLHTWLWYNSETI